MSHVPVGPMSIWRCRVSTDQQYVCLQYASAHDTKLNTAIAGTAPTNLLQGLIHGKPSLIWLPIPEWLGISVLQYKQMKEKNILSENAQTVLGLRAGVLYSSHSLHQIRLAQSCVQCLQLHLCVFNGLRGVKRNCFQCTRLPSLAICQQYLPTA